jgi:DNA repair exonuclease SbcCD ATPase subunit
MTTKFIPPTVLEQSPTHLDGTVAARQEALFKIRGETDKLTRELSDRQHELDTDLQSLAPLERELSTVLGRYHTSKSEAEEAVVTERSWLTQGSR